MLIFCIAGRSQSPRALVVGAQPISDGRSRRYVTRARRRLARHHSCFS